jgi:hypothetical protein
VGRLPVGGGGRRWEKVGRVEESRRDVEEEWQESRRGVVWERSVGRPEAGRAIAHIADGQYVRRWRGGEWSWVGCEVGEMG